MAGGYRSKTKKWHISYEESDAESEDLNVRVLLDSLHDDTKRSKASISKEPIALINAIFTDDEDESLKYFVSEVKFSEEFGCFCCFCVPYDGNEIKSKALAAKAMKENKYTDDCVLYHQII